LEDMPVANIKFVGGKLRADLPGELIDILDLANVPETGIVHMLRITDGETFKYLAVAQVLDIFSLPREIMPSACPNVHEGIIKIAEESVELLNIFQFFELASATPIAEAGRPLCFVTCNAQDHWERNILAPLLAASGYQVSFDEEDRDAAQIILGRDEDNMADNSDHRLLRLRRAAYSSSNRQTSVYRYDRLGLLSAIEHKLSGAN
jgi:two-component system, chemotaxis family, sensor kinase CheA